MSPPEPRVRLVDEADTTAVITPTRMPPFSLHGDILVQMLGFLDLQDVPSTTCVSKEFEQCMSKDEVWLPIALKREPTAVQLAQLLAPDPEAGPFGYKEHLKRGMEWKRQDSTTERRDAIVGTPRPLSAYVAVVHFVAYLQGEPTRRVSVVVEDLRFLNDVRSTGAILGMFIREDGTNREQIAAFWNEANDDFTVTIHLIGRSSGKQLQVYHCLSGESSNGLSRDIIWGRARFAFRDFHVHSNLSPWYRQFNSEITSRLDLECACECERCQDGDSRHICYWCCPPSPNYIGLQFQNRYSFSEEDILEFLEHEALFT